MILNLCVKNETKEGKKRGEERHEKKVNTRQDIKLTTDRSQTWCIHCVTDGY